MTVRDVKGKARDETESEKLVGKARSERLIECEAVVRGSGLTSPGWYAISSFAIWKGIPFSKHCAPTTNIHGFRSEFAVFDSI